MSYRPREKPQLYREHMGMWGSGKENWALLPALSEQLLQCILLVWDIYLLPRGITKALFGNILISGHLQCSQSQTRWPKINHYIESYIQMLEALLRKLILTLWNLKINRNQQTISRLLVRHWYSYRQFSGNLCTQRNTYCVYTPDTYGLSIPSPDAWCSHWLAQLLQSLIPSVISTHHYYYYLSAIVILYTFSLGHTGVHQQHSATSILYNLLRKWSWSVTRGQKEKRILDCYFSKTQNNTKYVCVLN